jgi:hypothetical protein
MEQQPDALDEQRKKGEGPAKKIKGCLMPGQLACKLAARFPTIYNQAYFYAV